MNETAMRVETIERIGRGDEARRLGHQAYATLIQDLGRLSDPAWAAPSPCDGWTVADIVRHLIGAAKSHVSMRENMRQLLWGRRHKEEFDGNDLDARNALQVADHADLDPASLLETLVHIGPRAVDARMSQPGLVRRISIPMPGGGSTADGTPGRLNMGELFDVILTRDVWVHRYDVARSIGSEPEVGEFDRRMVEDVVKEWSGRHGRAFDLTLTGPAGGRYVTGDGGPALDMDAVEFVETLAARRPGPGGEEWARLLSTRVIF